MRQKINGDQVNAIACFLFQKRYKPKDNDDMSKTRTLTLGQHVKGWFTHCRVPDKEWSFQDGGL